MTVVSKPRPPSSRLALTLRLAFGLALPVFFVAAQRGRGEGETGCIILFAEEER